MSQEEIIITTESVKVDELQGREKQIYDYAYQKGYDAAYDVNFYRKSRTVTIVALTLILVSFSILAVTCKPFPL